MGALMRKSVGKMKKWFVLAVVLIIGMVLSPCCSAGVISMESVSDDDSEESLDSEESKGSSSHQGGDLNDSFSRQGSNLDDASRVDYPNGYSHRPIMELFTSLSCVYCMEDAEPSTSQIWNEMGYQVEQPMTFIVYHLTNGGDHDDPLVIQESVDRYGEYFVPGTPDIVVDGGYRHSGSSYNDVKSAIDESGARTDSGLTEHFRSVDIYVSQIFNGNSIDVNVVVNYLGEASFLPSLADPTPLQDDLHGTLDLFMVEDGVDAYSSELGENVTCYNVFRGYAVHNVEITLNKGETFQGSYSWSIPTGLEVPINSLNVSVVAAVFDTQDTSSGGSESKPGIPRGIGSATPKSTAWDTKNEPPEVIDIVGSFEGGNTTITAILEDEQDVVKAFLVYNTKARDWNRTWEIKEMALRNGTGVTAEASLRMTEGATIYYKILSYDSNWTEGRSQVFNYTAGAVIGPEAKSFPTGLVVGFVIILLAAMLYFKRGMVMGMIGKNVNTPLETEIVGDADAKEDDGSTDNEKIKGNPKEAEGGAGVEPASDDK